MCRHAGYIGPRTSIAPIVTDLPHSLLCQSYASKELLPGVTVNADGFGVAWYDMDVRPEPGRYARGAPIWSDAELPDLGRLLHAPTFIAAVRSATIAGQNTDANAAPFTSGRWSWSLNGYLQDFESWRPHMEAEWVSPSRRRDMGGSTDGEWLFHAFLTRLDDGDEPTHAIRSLMDDVRAFGREHGLATQLNILASDGDHLFATRAGTEPASNSLHHLYDGDDFPDAHLIASEPVMPGDWRPVEHNTLLVLSAGAPPVRLPL